jgi:hypothetical protein
MGLDLAHTDGMDQLHSKLLGRKVPWATEKKREMVRTVNLRKVIVRLSGVVRLSYVCRDISTTYPST